MRSTDRWRFLEHLSGEHTATMPEDEGLSPGARAAKESSETGQLRRDIAEHLDESLEMRGAWVQEWLLHWLGLHASARKHLHGLTVV